MKRVNRGLSLMEVLVTLLLFALVMGMIASLVQNFARVSDQLDEKSASQRASLALFDLASEVEEATEVLVPAPGTVGPQSEIVLRKYASTVARLDNSTTADTWTPNYVLSVRYHLDQRNLMRQVTLPDGTVQNTLLAQEVDGFSATRVHERSIEARASFQERNKLETVATCAYRWGE